MTRTVGGYAAIKRMSPTTNAGWDSYIEWARLPHLTEVVTLDSLLCPWLIGLDDAPFELFVEAALQVVLFAELGSLLARPLPASAQVIYVVVKPAAESAAPAEGGFEKCGYDLLECGGSTSALTNCGGFDETFLGDELNVYGLLDDLASAQRIAAALPINNPHVPHALVDIFEIWKMVQTEKAPT